MLSDTLDIFHIEGREIFELVDCECGILEENGSPLFFLHARGKTAVIRHPELEFMPADPTFEISIPLPPGSPSLGKHSRFTLATGYDKEKKQRLSNFYYVCHHDIDQVEVSVTEVHSHGLELSVAGITGAAHEDGDTKFKANAVFRRNDSMKRWYV